MNQTVIKIDCVTYGNSITVDRNVESIVNAIKENIDSDVCEIIIRKQHISDNMCCSQKSSFSYGHDTVD